MLTGQCLCGGVKFTVTPVKKEMGTCHCSMCRRWSGGVSFSVDCGYSLKFIDEANLGIYHSSEHGERLFCKVCGSSLAWRARGDGMAFVSLQALPNPEEYKFVSEIFIDNKPANYDFKNDTQKMTEAEFIDYVSKLEI